jgi:thioredoxin 1
MSKNKDKSKLNHPNGEVPVITGSLAFQAQVLDSDKPVLVEFWTAWSKPCKVLDPVLVELARELAGKIKVVKVNADDNLDLSLSYDIQSIPTLVYFVRGNPCLRIIGTASKSAILANLKPFTP